MFSNIYWKRLRRCTAAPCFLAPCAGSCSRRWLPRFWPRFWICVAETAVCSFIWVGWVMEASLKKKQAGLLWHVSGWAWQARGTRKNMREAITRHTENKQKWHQHQLKSEIWAPPGRRQGFTREKKLFRRILGACFVDFGFLWSSLRNPWADPRQPQRNKNDPTSEKRLEKEGAKTRCDKTNNLINATRRRSNHELSLGKRDD